jgi:hypothetical protein
MSPSGIMRKSVHTFSLVAIRGEKKKELPEGTVGPLV